MKQTTLDKFFKTDLLNEDFDEVISLKVCDQLNGMTEEEYEDFMGAWID